MGVVSEPKYDGDLATKAYVDGLLRTINGEITTINGDITARSQNFGSEPIPPYYINDTYMNGTDIYICTTQRLIGSYNSADWSKASAYTDDTLASTKNKVFTSTPTTPYRLGDLWAGGPNGELRRCVNTRLTGTYNAADWENATVYDSTETVVEGGLITTGTIQVVQGGTVAAGMTGNTSGDTAVRFWAGSTSGNRNSAPFMVTQAGVLYASNATISGAITATSGSFTGTLISSEGTIGGFTLGASSLTASNIGMSTGSYGFWAGSNTSSGAPFRVTNAGALVATNANITGAVTATSGSFKGTVSATSISANSGTVGGFTLSTTGFSGSTSEGTMLIKRGSSAAIDFPANGGRLMLASSSSSPNVALTSAGGSGTNGLCIADSYGSTGSGASGYSIGIRAVFGSIRVAANSPYLITLKRSSGGSIEIGSNVNIQGGTVVMQSVSLSGATFTGGGGGYHYSNSNCMMNPASGYYAYINDTSSSNRIAVSSAGPSSRNVKTNIKDLKDDYNVIYKDLQKMKMYEYDYKYEGIKDYAHDYGFIIDEMEKLSFISKVAKNYSVKGFLNGNKFLKKRENDKEQRKFKSFKYKEWDRDTYIKSLFLLIKSMQVKIDELEKEIGKIKGGV